MYAIVRKLDGTYLCLGRIQDGTERWTETDLEAAVKRMKQFAKTMNGTKIKRKNIEYLERREVQKTEWVPVPMPGKK